MSWCRVLGAVLQAPFGPATGGAALTRPALRRPAALTQLGVADPDALQAGDAAHAIQRRLYALGWLTQPWRDMVKEVAARLREEPEMLFRMPGIGTQSGLDQWSSAVASGQVQPPVPTRCGGESSRCSPRGTVKSPTRSPARC